MKKRNNRMIDKVLALNAAMIPVDFKDPEDAFRIACKRRAFFFDTQWMRYTLDEWILEQMEKKNGGLKLGEFDSNMNTVKYEIPVPPVMVLEHYERIRPITINLNRENIWKRDGAACAYCRKELKLKEVELEHVVPKCRGGPYTWCNIVASCTECNRKKADQELKDIHDMELSIKPFMPVATSILYRLTPKEIENLPEFWKHFFVEFK